MTDLSYDLGQKCAAFQRQHTDAVERASHTAGGEPLLDGALPLLIGPPQAPAGARPSARGGAVREALRRFDSEAAAIALWLRGALAAVRSSADAADLDTRWAALEHLEREAAQMGRRFLFDRAAMALTRLPLLTRVMVTHVVLLLEMRRPVYGERRDRVADLPDAAECFALYADALRADLGAAVGERLAAIGSAGRGITDAWASEPFTADWQAWYAKVRVFDPAGDEFQHYLARVLRDVTLDLQDQVADVVRRTAALVGAPLDRWYAAPRPLRYGEVVQLRGGSLWPLVDGDGVGNDGALGDGAAGWLLVSVGERTDGGEVQTGEPFHLRRSDGACYLLDSDPDGGALPVGDAPQGGGSFFLRAMEIKPGKAAATGATYFLVGVHSGAYLQSTPEGALRLRPWQHTNHAGPDFPTWCFVEPRRPLVRALAPRALDDRETTLQVLGLLGNLPGDLGGAFSLLGSIVGLLWPPDPTPTWEEIKAYFQRELGKALAHAELGRLSNFMNGIENRLKTYKVNVDFVGGNTNPTVINNLALQLIAINDTLVQELPAFLNPVSATPLDTLPFLWRVARYKLCILKELKIYPNTALDIQYQIDSFVADVRPKLVSACIDRLMRERMGAVSGQPERYNEGMGAYLLCYRDNFNGRVFNVSNRDFMTTSNCSAIVNYPAYNAFAASELAKYRRSVRDGYLPNVLRTQVEPFNAMAKLSRNTPPIALTASGNDGWTAT